MSAFSFDTHAYIKNLKEKGASEPLAEALVEMFRDGQNTNMSFLATKADLRELELKTDTIKSELKADIAALEYRMTIKLGSMIVALGGVLIAIRFLGHG